MGGIRGELPWSSDSCKLPKMYYDLILSWYISSFNVGAKYSSPSARGRLLL
jgi:hypothetical protein